MVKSRGDAGKLVGALLLLAACASNPDEPRSSTAGEEPNEAGMPSGSGTADAPDARVHLPSPSDDTVSTEQIVDWGLWNRACAANGTCPSAEELMEGLAPDERAERILIVILTESLSAGRIEALVDLIAATNDPRAVEYIEIVFHSAYQIAARHVADALGISPTEAENDPLTRNEATRIQMYCISAATAVGGPDADRFLQSVSGDASVSAF